VQETGPNRFAASSFRGLPGGTTAWPRCCRRPEQPLRRPWWTPLPSGRAGACSTSPPARAVSPCSWPPAPGHASPGRRHPQMLHAAQANVGASPDRRPHKLVLGRAEDLPFADATFEALTFTYLLRYVADPPPRCERLVRVVKPGGVVRQPGVPPPRGIPWYPLWAIYTHVVLPAAGWHWAEGVVRGGPLPGPRISRNYRRLPVSWHVDAWRAAGAWKRSHPRHEPGRGGW